MLLVLFPGSPGRERALAEITGAIACAESAIDHAYDGRDSESLDALWALREALLDLWPHPHTNLLHVLDVLERDGTLP